MSKRRYNQHLRDENPFSVLPRTTRWRHLQALKVQHLQELEVGEEPNQSTSDGSLIATTASTPRNERDDYARPSEDSRYNLDGEDDMEHLESDDGSSECSCSIIDHVDDFQVPSDESLTELVTLDHVTDILPGEETAPAEWLQGEVDNSQFRNPLGNCETDHDADTNTTQEEDDNGDGELDWYDCTDDFGNDSGSNGDSPLYQGASITLIDSLTLILLFSLKHSLTGVCLQDLLHLISLHCMTPNLCKTSLYLFQKVFANFKSPLVFHKFCNLCEILLSSESIASGTCAQCNNLLIDDHISYFIEIPMIAQLQKLYQRDGFFSDLQHRFKREKKNENNIEDVYDGSEYKRHFAPGGFLQNPNNISFFWYVDGVPLFKSTKYSLWPLYFSINELPYYKRIKKENMIFAGLWFGSKPSMSTFLKPFSAALKKLRNGFEVDIPNRNSPIIVKVLVLGGTCDLPAKAMMLNMMQYNGSFGCSRCKQEGNVVTVGRGHSRVYPYSKENPDGPKRSHTETLQNATAAFQTKAPVNGIKGPSWFMYLGADIIRGTAVDYMHQVLLGLIRKLLTLWFSSTYSSELFSLSKFVAVVDERLKSIKPPNFITRIPRSISDHMKYWKASECRSWLFYYSVPLISDIMDDMFFKHHLLLVEAIFLLNSTSISSDILAHCDILLKEYVCMFSVLYGEKMMSMNLHLLLHLTEAVKDLGPLWVQSCFHFEGVNGSLLKFFHGTQRPEVQIANTIGTMLTLPLLIQNLKSDTARSFYYSYLCPKSFALKRELVQENVWVLGAPIQIVLPQNVVTLLTNFYSEKQNITFSIYARLLSNHMIFQSKSWTMVKRRNSFTIAYHFPNSSEVHYGQVEYYVKSSFPEVKCFAVVKPLRKLPCPFKFKHFEAVHAVKLNVDEEYFVVPICHIMLMCVFVQDVNSEEKGYVILPPNTCESD